MILVIVFFVFERRYQKKDSSGQPINVNFKFRKVPAGAVAFALIKTNKLKSNKIDRQRHSDLK